MFSTPDRRRGGIFARRRAGFTLVELVSSLTLASIISAGVLSTVLLLGRSGASAVSYLTMTNEARRALDHLTRDVQTASAVVLNSPSSITVTVPGHYTSTGNLVTYAWDDNPASPTYRCLYQMAGAASAANPRLVLARNVSRVTFERFDRRNQPTTADLSTRRVHVVIGLASSSQTVPNATDHVAASFVLRNKPTS